MRPPAGPAYWWVMSAILIFPWSAVTIVVVGFLHKRRKNKKLREQEEKERGATP